MDAYITLLQQCNANHTDGKHMVLLCDTLISNLIAYEPENFTSALSCLKPRAWHRRNITLPEYKDIEVEMNEMKSKSVNAPLLYYQSMTIALANLPLE